MAPITSIKRKPLTNTKKLSIILQIEQKKPVSQVASEFKLPVQTVYGIYRNRDKIRANVTQFGGSCKKSRKCEFPKTEKLLTEWFDKKREKNIPLDG